MTVPYIYYRPLRWGDTDAARIVYTAHYFDICMEALEGWFIDILETDWFSMNADLGIGTPFVHAEVDFRAPVTPRDTLSVQIDIERIGNKSLSFILNGFRARDSQSVFDGRFTCCFSNMSTFEPIDIPEWVREPAIHYQEESRRVAAELA
ncbi:acyl-CoA thioesterase [Marinobacter sp.]|uniref:acyl-CoA thioesterase n=1 Tax=Marinobacter sp. TaxID=50741 RepID=UPI00384E25BE